MIGKVSSGASFSGLAKYLTQNEERVAWTEPRWMIGTDPQEVAREMETAASQASSRLERPVYHVSISFGEADAPTREQMREAADRVLGELGLSEHQALLVAHEDKGHPHLHVMVNRVHPDTGKAADVGFDYRRVEGVLRELEKEWGMQRVPGHHARDAGEAAPDRTQSVATGEARRAHRTGKPPFPEQIRETMKGDLDRAIEQSKSWDELRAALGRYGYRIEPTERGMKITDGERYAKASGVDERLGRFRLEDRFGERLTPGEQRDAAQHGTSAEREVPKRTSAPDGKAAPLKGRGQGEPGAPGEGTGASRAAALGERNAHPSAYESVFGKPALERAPTRAGVEGSIPGSGAGPSGGGGQLLGAAAVAARPISSEDGEKEVPFRATELGLRGAAAFAGRSGVSTTEDRSSAEPAKVSESREAASANQSSISEGAEGPATGAPSAKAPMVDPATYHEGAPPTATAPNAEVRAVVRDVQAYERFTDLEARLGRAVGAYAEAERALQSGGRQGQEAARLSATFDRALQSAYRDPAAARRGFETMAEQHGPEAAARAMRHAPEQFGAVRAAERKKWLGLASEVSKADGYAAARGAANVGEQYLHTRQAAPDTGSRAVLEGSLKTRGAEMKALRQELGRFASTHGSPTELLRSIGEQTQKLTTAQMNGLRRTLTPQQFSVVTKAAGLAAEAVKGRAR